LGTDLANDGPAPRHRLDIRLAETEASPHSGDRLGDMP
jgi:hypothetical protein